MVTTSEIEAIHELIGTREGYGRNRLTAELEARAPEEVNEVYRTMLAYACDIKRLNPREVIHLTDRLILGLQHVTNRNPGDLSTYIEVACFGEPLDPEHIEHAEHRRTTSERRFSGATSLAYLDGTDPEEDE